MTETAIVCSICGCDKFFLFCHSDGSGCDLVCSGCGVRTDITVSKEDNNNLVRAPE